MTINLRSVHEVDFTNSFVDQLSGDHSEDIRSRQVPNCCYSRVRPTPVRDPRLIAWSDELADYLGLSRPNDRGLSVDVLGGNLVTASMKPFAARYGGHQFGNWAGQLGDGRAISLGEVRATDGSTQEIQLKGAGSTPYSRRADGRAVLRSSVREFLCSEAMHWLGVPTTRALSLVATGDTVVRDMFYSGDPRPEPGAIVTRVAPTFIRFGNFEMMAVSGELENLKSLANYVLRRHYPELGEPCDATYVRWFEEICRRTAMMISHWMSVGFVHGVMNTDNMSILGLTIDYGPYGWLEPYEPDWTPNTTDFGSRRYAFGQQPHIGLWNLLMLARALFPLLEDGEQLRSGLERYQTALETSYQQLMLRKLGLNSRAAPETAQFLKELEEGLTSSGVDMTQFFRQLSYLAPELQSSPSNCELLMRPLLDVCSYADPSRSLTSLAPWFHKYSRILNGQGGNPETVRREMLAANPKYVLRNYLAQQVIEAATEGNLAPLEQLMQVLKSPFDEQPGQDHLAAIRPEWARNKPGCATLSCSS